MCETCCASKKQDFKAELRTDFLLKNQRVCVDLRQKILSPLVDSGTALTEVFLQADTVTLPCQWPHGGRALCAALHHFTKKIVLF